MRKKIEGGKAEASAQLEAVQSLFFPDGPVNYDVVGFKTKTKDILDRDGFTDLLKESNVRVILLQRRNRIKLLVSLINAVRLNAVTGDWNLYDESDRQPMLHIDVAEFDKWLKKTELANQDLNSYVHELELPTLNLFYEDVLTDSTAAFTRICSFLGVADEPVNGKCKKNTSDDLRNAIANFDELRESYTGTKYLEMFDQVLIAHCEK